VHIVSTAKTDLRGIARLGRALATGKLPVYDLRAQLGRAPLEPATPVYRNPLLDCWTRCVTFGAQR
jgi:hypothetical protein